MADLGLPFLYKKEFKISKKIALWCNGSTSDSGSACLGSNPSGAT